MHRTVDAAAQQCLNVCACVINSRPNDESMSTSGQRWVGGDGDVDRASHTRGARRGWPRRERRGQMGGGCACSIFFGRKQWQRWEAFMMFSACCLVVHFPHETSTEKERE